MQSFTLRLASVPVVLLVLSLAGCAATHGAGGAGFIPSAGDPTYRVSPDSVHITRFAFPAGYDAYQIAKGADGALWFTEFQNNKIGRITTGGTFSEYNVPTLNSNPNGIFAGPDNAMWFTERTASKIGRISITTHAITEFSTPTASAQPRDIVAGPDGKLWFTEYGASKIGRITTTGHIKEYAADVGGPEGITSGTKEGRLWYTGSIANQNGIVKVGNMTTAGLATYFNIPTHNSEPWGITPGPSRNDAWFVEMLGRKVGRVSPSGQFHEYTIPGLHPLATPFFIVVGPDGALWFTDNSRNSIGRVTTNGQFSGYSLGQGAYPEGIVLGPDGALWFTEVNAIGRLQP